MRLVNLPAARSLRLPHLAALQAAVAEAARHLHLRLLQEEPLLVAVVEWLAAVVESEQVSREAPTAHKRQAALVAPRSEEHLLGLPLVLGHLRVRRRGGARRGESRNIFSSTGRLKPQAPTGLLCNGGGIGIDAARRWRSWVMHGRCGGKEEP